MCEINLTGDFDLDLRKNDSMVPQYRDFLKRIGLTNVIHEVTHIKQHELGFSLIDHYLTTMRNCMLTPVLLQPTLATTFLYIRVE